MYLINTFISVVAGEETAAQAALAQFARDVEKKEPDTWFLLIHTPNLDPGVKIFPPPAAQQIGFIEGFRNRQAYFNHFSSPLLKAFIKKYGALFLNMYGPAFPFMTVQGLIPTEGFIREEMLDPNVYQVEARWVVGRGKRERVKKALVQYVQEVFDEEPETYMYTANFAEVAPRAPSMPPGDADALVYNSAWKDQAAFFAHGSGKPYQDFLAKHGHLFVQALGAPTDKQPYMTTSVMKRFAGFIRPKAFGRV